MDVQPLALAGVLEVLPRRFEDHRGFFSESWNKADFQRRGLCFDFVQDNHSLSRTIGTVRGLHYQKPPMAQDKLVRAIRGRVFDVIVDIRRGSLTYGRWVSLILDAEKGNQVLVPKGFAHGIQTLEPDCEIEYKITAPYSPEHERSIRWDDPIIGINWPLPVSLDSLSPKDRVAPLLYDQDTGF